MPGIDRLLETVHAVYSGEQIPRSFALVEAALAVRKGEDAARLAPGLNTTPRRLTFLSLADDPASEVFKVSPNGVLTDMLIKSRRGIGQLLLAALAEKTFERLYRQALGSENLTLEDHRTGHNETDFRVLDAAGRPVFRLNIKFHGTMFEKAHEMVGLDPPDCFALATYKIWQGMERQQQEVLPYVFAVVSVPGLTADSVGAAIPDELVELAAFVYAGKISGKRQVEDRIVEYLLQTPVNQRVGEAVAGFGQRVESAEWRVISARRADRLLRDMLFERVFAVRQRSFARTQVNMHFSLSADFTTLGEFLRHWRERGPQGLASAMERGIV